MEPLRTIFELSQNDKRSKKEHWSAWFADLPQHAARGEWPSQAIEKLLILHQQLDLEPRKVQAIDSASRDGHLEFLIPVRDGRPRPSRN